MPAPQRKLSGEYYSYPYTGDVNNLANFLRRSAHCHTNGGFGILSGWHLDSTEYMSSVDHKDAEYNIAEHRQQIFFEVKRKWYNNSRVVPKFYIDANGNEHTIKLYNNYRPRWFGLFLVTAAILLMVFANAIPGVGHFVLAVAATTLFMKGGLSLLEGFSGISPIYNMVLPFIGIPSSISMLVTAAPLLMTNPVGLAIGAVLLLWNLYLIYETVTMCRMKGDALERQLFRFDVSSRATNTSDNEASNESSLTAASSVSSHLSSNNNDEQQWKQQQNVNPSSVPSSTSSPAPIGSLVSASPTINGNASNLIQPKVGVM